MDVEKLNVKKYASKTGIAMVLTDYLLYVEHNVRKALEICSEATKENDFKSWWWKARLGKCYFKLGKKVVILVRLKFESVLYFISISYCSSCAYNKYCLHVSADQVCSATPSSSCAPP